MAKMWMFCVEVDLWSQADAAISAIVQLILQVCMEFAGDQERKALLSATNWTSSGRDPRTHALLTGTAPLVYPISPAFSVI